MAEVRYTIVCKGPSAAVISDGQWLLKILGPLSHRVTTIRGFGCEGDVMWSVLSPGTPSPEEQLLDQIFSGKPPAQAKSPSKLKLPPDHNLSVRLLDISDDMSRRLESAGLDTLAKVLDAGHSGLIKAGFKVISRNKIDAALEDFGFTTEVARELGFDVD